MGVIMGHRPLKKGIRKKEKAYIQKQNNYTNFLEEIKTTISKAKLQVVRTVNKQLISLYWNIGSIIVSRQAEYKWGKSVVEQLAKDLHYEYPDIKGFSARNLWDMRRFYMVYKDDKFLRQAVAEIPWSHNLMILNMVKTVQERKYYIRAVKKMGWTRNVLLNQIKADAYKRHKLMPKTHNFAKVLPVHLAEQADETIKSEYNMEFLGIARPVLEKKLEKRLLEKIKHFILELGYGFTFIGNQYCLKISDKEYYIDLLFFNRKLKSLVV